MISGAQLERGGLGSSPSDRCYSKLRPELTFQASIFFQNLVHVNNQVGLCNKNEVQPFPRIHSLPSSGWAPYRLVSPAAPSD